MGALSPGMFRLSKKPSWGVEKITGPGKIFSDPIENDENIDSRALKEILSRE